MAQGDRTEQKLVVATVEHKTWDKKRDGVPTGEKGELWKVLFVGGVYPSSTFSKNCAAALEGRLGTELVYTLTGSKPFQDKDQWVIDKVIDPATGEVVYEPDASEKNRGGGGNRGGYSRPDWTYENVEERLETRLSIEAQKALDLAVQTLAAVVVYDNDLATGPQAIEFVSSAQRAYANLLRESVDQKSGSGSRHSGAGGQRQQGGDGTKGSKGSVGEGHAAREPAPASAKTQGVPSATVPSNVPSHPSIPDDGLPTPEPDSSSIEALLKEIDALTGSRNKTLLEYKRVLKKAPVDMTPQELAIVKSDLRDPASV